jgi:hypothetical protein
MQRESRYAEMTTNERLFDAGLLSEWTAAARLCNRERMEAKRRAVECSRVPFSLKHKGELARILTCNP